MILFMIQIPEWENNLAYEAACSPLLTWDLLSQPIPWSLSGSHQGWALYKRQQEELSRDRSLGNSQAGGFVISWVVITSVSLPDCPLLLGFIFPWDPCCTDLKLTCTLSRPWCFKSGRSLPKVLWPLCWDTSRLHPPIAILLCNFTHLKDGASQDFTHPVVISCRDDILVLCSVVSCLFQTIFIRGKKGTLYYRMYGRCGWNM